MLKARNLFRKPNRKNGLQQPIVETASAQSESALQQSEAIFQWLKKLATSAGALAPHAELVGVNLLNFCQVTRRRGNADNCDNGGMRSPARLVTCMVSASSSLS